MVWCSCASLKMFSLTSLLIVLTVGCLAPPAVCRPQEEGRLASKVVDDTNFIWQPEGNRQSRARTGSILGELQVFSEIIAVQPNRKPSRSSGPRTSALVSGPVEGSFSVGSGTGVSTGVGVADSPALTISGGTITFNNPASVVPIEP